jgi:hypothetical protein
MKNYYIKINKKYLTGFKETEIKSKEGTGGWYDINKNITITKPILEKNEINKKIIEGNTNLKSCIDKILKYMKEVENIKSIEIEEIILE